jgi:histidyl-tRNA synthetase
MAKVKVGIPQGTRDFGPEVVRKRNYIFDTIRNIFELYGFQPLETPAMENLDTLMGKYGEEGDKLIFKILNNGLDNPEKEKQIREDFEKVLQGKNVKDITERALKYDLTIPFARYVAMNHAQLTFPFKRYQIQPVWRADRPQKSRYREFYQCDADVVGSNSLLNEIELAGIYHEVFIQLWMTNYELRINHRKILSALGELCGDMDKITDITIAIDKLDKIGLEKVKEELEGKGLPMNQVAIIEKYLNISGSNEEKLAQVKELFGNTETAQKGIKELEFIMHYGLTTHLPIAIGAPLTIDFTLARGLNYYTGIIFEAKAPAQVTIGSIGGGGRYDDLTGLFGVPNIPGVGISFGVDRIYDVMEELKLFPIDLETGTKVMFLNMGETESQIAFGWMQQLRHKGVSCELYHEPAKMDKQFKYAEKKNILYVITIAENDNCKIKNIRTGEQQLISMNDLLQFAF